MAAKDRARGKAEERRAAGFFRSIGRTPNSGAMRDYPGDIIHARLHVECKNHASIGVVGVWWEKAASEARDLGKIPVLWIRRTGGPALLVMRPEDIGAVHAEAEPTKAAPHRTTHYYGDDCPGGHVKPEWFNDLYKDVIAGLPDAAGGGGGGGDAGDAGLRAGPV